MAGRGPSPCQIAYSVVRRDVRAGLRDAAAQTGVGGFGSVSFRAGVALYALLLAHPVDRQGRCDSCRRPEAIIGGRRRACRVYPLARYWLDQSWTALASSLTRELGLDITPPAPSTGPGWDRPGLVINGRADQQATDTARIENAPPSPTLWMIFQSPVVSPATRLPGRFPETGWPVRPTEDFCHALANPAPPRRPARTTDPVHHHPGVTR